MAHAFYHDFSLRKVILTRGRWQTITTHKIAPQATLVCTDQERPLYEAALGNQVAEYAEIPHELLGMGKIRNWVLGRFPEECIFTMDDDLEGLDVRTHEKNRFIFEPAIIEQIIDNSYLCARDAGAKVFGYGVDRRPFHFRANRPFVLNVWTDQGWGIIGREIRFDDRLTSKIDVDLCMLSMMKHRIVWIDDRYSWRGVKRGNVGGLSAYRTSEREMANAKYLERKWGKYLHLTRKQKVSGVSVAVGRQQPGIPCGRVS
jgi:hypothetical protein